MLQLGLERDGRLAPPPRDPMRDSLAAPVTDSHDLDMLADGPSPDDGVDGGAYDPQRSFLLASFRGFYAEVIRLREAAVRDPGQLLPTDAAEYTPDHGTAQIARAISHRLQNLLEQLALDAGARSGEYGASVFSEAQYVMAAAADEVFLTTDWSGREAWLAFLLERALFRTQIAGEEIFRRIDKLLTTRTGVAAELGSVYFMALGAGFEGQYRGTGDPALRDYRQRLYRFIFRRDARRTSGALMPQPYDHIAPPTRATRLPLVQRWALVLGVTIVTYLTVSHIVWRSVTQDLRAIHADIRRVIAESAQDVP
ncbi:MAG: DotU family type secretion system protein [Gemmatimonadetes bacterium]|nr:DotU family type secretion system protein [Gemmatimonadota bacterium]